MVNTIVSIVFTALVFLGLDWLTLPAWNLRNPGLYILIIVSLIIGAVFSVILDGGKKKNKGPRLNGSQEIELNRTANIMCILAGLAALVLVVGVVSSMTIFNVSRYNSVAKVETKDFSEVLPENEDISKIAIMDTNTATVIGKRAMGSVVELVSQYEVSETYSTISYNNRPIKIAPLEYGGIFKYFSNKDTGIPGYISVDPVKNTAQYVELKAAMRYTASAVFSEDLMRHIRGTYKTEMLDGTYFEIDEDGNPWWICPVIKPIGGLFGGRKITDVIMVDACTGDMNKVTVGDVPNWVDRVYDGNLLCEYYDDYGKLQNGFWNSIFGQKNCVMTTEDYGYKIIDDDVWVYTGVTSVASDESNIGFVLMNQRTMETIYFACGGAEEFSAMSAAEGMVQDLGYEAAFPSLINTSGVPTYVMCLKDGAGLVKMYAMVNVEQYNMVGIGNTQTDALKNYKAVLAQNNVDIKVPETEVLEKTIVIDRIEYLIVNGESVCYIVTEDGEAFKQAVAENEALVLLKAGDRLTVKYSETDMADIYIIK